MSESKSIDIVCSRCGADTLLIRKPVYDGFKKTGEALTCAACGYVYPDEEQVPFKNRPNVNVFTEADRSAPVKVFREDEKGKVCRYCESYVINPFMQWCSIHKKEVEATDTCSKFTKKKDPPPEKPEEKVSSKSILL